MSILNPDADEGPKLRLGLPKGSLQETTVSLFAKAGYDVRINDARDGVCRFRPHGVMAVIGPFNFPVHLPNGHIAPALLAGNTVIFKPSDKVPACGQLLASMYAEALERVGAPAGTFNLLHGAGTTAGALTSSDGVDGVLADFQTRQVGQEVISHEETHKHPVIDGSFEIVGEREVWHG